jgi:transposase
MGPDRIVKISGGLTTLKLYLARLKPTPQSEPLLLFETEPGRQPQADLATIQRGRRAPVSIHCDSRPQPHGLSRARRGRAARNAARPSWARLRTFRRGTREVLYDNMDTVVIERDVRTPRRFPRDQNGSITTI